VLVDPWVAREALDHRRRHGHVGRPVLGRKAENRLELRPRERHYARAHTQWAGERERHPERVEEGSAGKDGGAVVDRRHTAQRLHRRGGRGGDVPVREADALRQAAGAARERDGRKIPEFERRSVDWVAGRLRQKVGDGGA
jgi:hypothetical protein